MVNSWTLLRLNPQKQSRYIEHVAENIPGVEMYFPVYNKTTRPHGRRQPLVVILPVYPGYIFANVDVNGEGIYSLIRTPIRARFIRFGPEISLIPDKVIVELRRLERLSMLMRESYVNPYTPGRKIRIHTPVADIAGIIIRLMNGDRVEVDSPIGRMTVKRHLVALG
jgi:transcription antitermination factor NusG